MKRSSGKGVSWKTKKHIAEVLCVVVVVLSMTVSLYFQAIHNTDYKKDISLAQQAAQTKVMNYGNSATLRMDTSTVENAAERDTYTAVQENSAAGSVASPKNNSGNFNDIKRNLVVSDMQGTNAPNRVVTNSSAFSLVASAFENHGTALEWNGADMLYQYPVELGYPVDNNYDGKQTEKGIIQDYNFDTAAEELYSDNREEEDQTDESEESVTEETTEESDTEEATTEEPVTEETTTEEPMTEAATTEESVTVGTTTEELTEENSVGDAEDSTQDSGESVQNSEEKKTTPAIDKGFQKKVQSKMLPSDPVQVNVSVKTVKKTVNHTKKKLGVLKRNYRKAIKAGTQALIGRGTTGSDTDALTEGETTEIVTEAPVEEETTESDTEASTEEGTTESNTEAPGNDGNTGNDTEAPNDEENTGDGTESQTVENEAETLDNEETTEKTSEDGRIEADGSFFVISGKMRVDSQVFVSDIKVKPTGKDGFNKVRIGTQGDFLSSVTLTEDANEKDVTLYFSDGQNVTTGVTFAYSKDTSNPTMSFDGASCNVLHGSNANIYCTNDAELELVLEDGSNGTGVDKVCFAYGDRVADFTNMADGSKANLSQDFYGRVLMNCADKAGNVSSVLSQYILLDRVTPTIQFSQDEICTTPYTLWVDVADNGSIVSGLADVACTVNGEPIEISNLEPKGVVTLDDNLEVPQRVGFTIPFEEEGEFTIQVRAVDYAGNTVVEERTITVSKPEFVSVFMPETFTIHIDPQRLLENEQIFSDNIELVNVSEFDVKVTVDSIDLYVNDEVSPEGIEKDCDIYFVTPDTGERIKLEKGKNKDVYSYCLPENATGDIANLYFVGSTTEGSDQMWQSSDISIVVNLSFRKWRGE